MKNHTNDCEVTRTGVCTCMVVEPHPHPKVRLTTADREDYRHRFGKEPTMRELYDWKQAKNSAGKAGTSRTVDTEPKITWLGDTMHVHPPSCGVYKSPEPNWAPYCDCFIAVKQRQPPTEPEPEVPKEYRPSRQEFISRAPWWVWTLIGTGAGLAAGTLASGWPW